jgi:hypothetical protein
LGSLVKSLRAVLCALAVVSGGALPAATAGGLSLDERIAAQRAIEEVFWKHRIWPAENAGKKPPLENLLPDEAIRAKVIEGLAYSEALEKFWGRQLTPEQLRAEVERMAGATRDPSTLRELFAALGNDPERIAECLARPALAERLARSGYASDARFHAAARHLAEQALATARGPGSLRALGAEYAEVTWVEGTSEPAGAATRRPGEIAVESKEEWGRLVARLAGWFGLHPSRGGRRGDPRFAARPDRAVGLDRLPDDRISPLQEAESRFFAAAILRRAPGSITVATASWPRRSFEDWWGEVRDGLVTGVSAQPVGATLAAASPHGALPEITGAACTDDQWAGIRTGEVPEERDSHTAVWTGTEMIVWGGSGVAGALGSGGRYHPATDTWTPTPVDANTPSPRWNHTAIWTGTEMIVWGGYSGIDDTNTGGRYNPTTGAWTPTSVGAGVPAIRESHTAVWTGSEMIVWGGDSVLVGFLNTGGRYAPSSGTWTPTSGGGGVPSVRSLHTAVWTGTEMIVWGGSNDLGFTNTGGRYDPVGDSWTPTAVGTGVPAARSYHSAVWTGNEMVVWGGSSDTGYLSSGARYRVSPEGWTPMSGGTNTPSARYLQTAVWTGSELMVWGGFSGTRYVNTGGRYNPLSDTWAATANGAAAPATRGYHTTVWTGTEMIVWGGYFYDGSDHELDSGGRYDPGTDSWTPTTAWADRRRLHTAVWTGSEMIVWGGERSHPPAPAFRLASGGRYVPATDSWKSTSMGTGVPAPREYHTAVWTGTEMIVWGGYDPPAAEYNTGGRYDPAHDSWTATSTSTGTPVARDTHTAVWTGTEMLVWGGWDGFSSFGTGGRYAPSSNTWTPTAAGPQGRFAHTAVWSGSEMIVWGGENYTGGGTATWLNSGGRYAPATNTWSATPSDASTPAARAWHVAVWAGDRMIVWGGRAGASFHDTGGSYVPGAMSFTSTGTGTAVPSPRAYAAAVWTGAEMIVWGGSYGDGGGQQFLGTGGRYAPSGDRWVPTSTGTSVPSARDSHTAVWTGSELIVWGGRDAASSLASGGRYCAAICSSPAPTGTPQLSVTDDNVTATISWTAATGATGYDLVRGGLASLRASGGNYTVATGACLADDTPSMIAADGVPPPAGDGFWYLARGVSCGGNGTYDSGAPSQAGNRDAEINASANGCP